MMLRAIARLGLAGAVAAFVTGCPIPAPPDAKQLQSEALPNTKLPEKFIAAPADASEVVDGWLVLFKDPELEKLVAEAMAYNTDLRVAASRVEVAAASARAAGATLWPQLNILAHGGGKMGGDASGTQLAGLFASWELDLWGRVRSERYAASSQYEAAVFDNAYARNSIAAMVAKSWFLAREASMQRAIALEMVQSSQGLAGLARDRLRVGKGDELEVVQAEASVYSYRDLALQADRARQEALRAVEVLAGRYPAAQVDAGIDLPKPPPIPVGLPSQLLERRPDVRAAERRVGAAYYRTTEARAARLPRISLSASVNTISSDLFVMKQRDNPVWSLGGSILFPLFTGGALEAQVDVRNAEQKAAMADFANVGSRAFGEVENALGASYNLDAREETLAGATAVNERALGFSRVRLNVGSGDQRAVLQQLLALHTSRASLIHVRAERLMQRVNLHLALGGGFDMPPPPPQETGKEQKP
jgi:NodT family efflux transporter outer membrane factor (OMF) lipoprotein